MAMILDAFVGRYVNKLSKLLEGEMSKMLGADDEFKKLHRRMERIRGFLKSAERKRYADPNIDMWVKELKDIMYDAEDIIDLCMIEGRELLEDHPSKSVVRHPLSLFSYPHRYKFQHKIGSKIKELNNRLKEMVEDRSILSTVEDTREDARVSGVNLRQTFPIEVRSHIVGSEIEETTQSLVESLIQDNDKKCQIFGIAGMSGIGKTTLASSIYHDEKIIESFPIRVWVCVSQEFSETELLEQIIKGADEKYKCGEAQTKAKLVPLLCSKLSKRFFIILDDLYTTDVWEQLLQYPIKSAVEKYKCSGRILITTQYEDIARNMGAEIHHVHKMDINNGWALLCKNVFGDDEEEEEISGLKEIGFQIIEKCDGLPLAIKTIAGVLRSKDKSTIEWNKVLKSDAWSMSQLHEEPSRALFLSYENLPSHLKQCFLYCSLYPEDYHMSRTDLISYWVAEGFVETAQQDILMEDLAENYYRELISRNLLYGHDDDTYCTMHDLLRSLALFLIRDESIFLGDKQSPDINPLTKIRRLSMVNMGERVNVPDAIKQEECLRTLLLWQSSSAKMVKNDLFKRLRFLRVMDLSNVQLKNLPDSIGGLVHLRYLNLNRTDISNLPESIGCLVNLQILNLSNCSSLLTLPKAITKLCNLRCLNLNRALPLPYIPKGIGKLKHLNHLEGFVVGHNDRRGMQDDEGCKLEELLSLSYLRFVKIERLERAQPVGALVLSNSRYLRTLILNCGRTYNDQEEAIATQRIDEIYNELSPQSTHLQRLEIRWFIGTTFPSWIMSPSLGASFPNLTSISLYDCKSCPQLPPLGILPQLKSLTIKKADAIKTIGPEFVGPRASSSVTVFPKLEVLTFGGMTNWEEWSFGVVEGVGEERRGAPKLLPRLRELCLIYCPKLRALPEGLRHATSLQELVIRDSSNLKEIDNLPFLTNKLLIMESGLERVSNLPSLKSLEIRFCPRLEHVENLGKLQRLEVWLSPPTKTSTTGAVGETEHLPRWLLELLGQHQNAPAALQNLNLACSLPLLKTFLKDGPNWPIIQWIPRVRIGERYGGSYIEYTRDPPAFKTNVVE